MTTAFTDTPMIDASEAEASAMWIGRQAGECGRRRGEPYVRSAAEFHAGEPDLTRSGLTGFVDGRRSGIVRVTATRGRETVRVAADIALDDDAPGSGVRRLEATVRVSWLRRVMDGAAERAEEAVRIVRALEQIAALPGQTTVLVRAGGAGAK